MVLVMLLAAKVAKGSVVSECFVSAVERVESEAKSTAVGDNGRAKGSFQFWAAAWEDVNRVRVGRGQSRIDYSFATNRAVARLFAFEYLRIIESHLAKLLNRPPTRGEVYAAFNCGVSRFTQLGASLRKAPATTRRAVVKIETTLSGIHNGDRVRRQVNCGSLCRVGASQSNRGR